MVERRTRHRKVSGLRERESGGRIFFFGVIFCADSYFGIRSTPVLPQQHVNDPGYFAKSGGGNLQLHMHPIIIVIMYIYHALINALSAHMIHINLNMIFYTHVDHSPTKTSYRKYYTHTHIHTHTHTHPHSDCRRNWVLILVRMEILWEEEGFQFGFKRWQGWAVSKVLWEWIPNVNSHCWISSKPSKG